MRTLGEIADLIDAKLIGDSNAIISGMASLTQADNHQISYITSAKHCNDLRTSNAGAVILNARFLDSCQTNALLVKDTYLAFAHLSHFFKKPAATSSGIHSSAVLNQAKIGAHCVIGAGVVLGKHVTIGAHCIIEDGVCIGNNTHLQPNTTVLRDCSIGDNTVISSGAVIGSEGFGNAQDSQKHWHTVAHLGNVVIGKNVTIGANTTIDRGTLDNTEIHDGVRIDNLVHIAHNVIIGQDCAIAACTGIAGSTVLGKRCMIGGMVGIVGHLTLCDDVIVNAKSTVDKNIKHKGVYTGITPLMTHKQWQNVSLWLTKLDKITRYLGIKLNDLKQAKNL